MQIEQIDVILNSIGGEGENMMPYGIGKRCARYVMLFAAFWVILCLFWFFLIKAEARNAAAKVLTPSAPGLQKYASGAVTLDVSNVSQGYVMLNYAGSNPKVKFRMTMPTGESYTYLVTGYGNYMAYPLTGGNGNYTFAIYESVSMKDNMYSTAFSKSMPVTIENTFLPFLYPNYYVSFQASSACVSKAEALAQGCVNDLDVVAAVYHYIKDNIVYDNAKAATVQSGYAPFPDSILAVKKGICFDYASLMAAMLRSQGIPTRLEVGYVGSLYHAWISCYMKDVGWIDGIIQFDGSSWTLMDPTMAVGQSAASLEKFIKSNTYSIKYIY